MEVVEALNTRWTLVFKFNTIMYVVLTIQPIILQLAMFIWELKFTGLIFELLSSCV